MAFSKILNIACLLSISLLASGCYTQFRTVEFYPANDSVISANWDNEIEAREGYYWSGEDQTPKEYSFEEEIPDTTQPVIQQRLYFKDYKAEEYYRDNYLVGFDQGFHHGRFESTAFFSRSGHRYAYNNQVGWYVQSYWGPSRGFWVNHYSPIWGWTYPLDTPWNWTSFAWGGYHPFFDLGWGSLQMWYGGNSGWGIGWNWNNYIATNRYGVAVLANSSEQNSELRRINNGNAVRSSGINRSNLRNSFRDASKRTSADNRGALTSRTRNTSERRSGYRRSRSKTTDWATIRSVSNRTSSRSGSVRSRYSATSYTASSRSSSVTRTNRNNSGGSSSINRSGGSTGRSGSSEGRSGRSGSSSGRSGGGS